MHGTVGRKVHPAERLPVACLRQTARTQQCVEVVLDESLGTGCVERAVTDNGHPEEVAAADVVNASCERRVGQGEVVVRRGCPGQVEIGLVECKGGVVHNTGVFIGVGESGEDVLLIAVQVERSHVGRGRLDRQ